MSILIDESTPVIVQGFTGSKATFHAKEMIAYGTNLVGGVTPGKGGQRHLDRPVFNTVYDAVQATGATTSLAFVPPAYAAEFKRLIPHARVEIIERCGHIPQIEQPNAFYRAVTAFIGEHS